MLILRLNKCECEIEMDIIDLFHNEMGVSCLAHIGFIQQRGKAPPPLDFRPDLFQHATTSRATILLGPQNTPEVTSEGLNFKHFLGKHTPTPPRSSVIHIIHSIPSLTETG